MSRVALVVHEGREAAVRAAGDIEAMLAAEGAETARAHDGEVPRRPPTSCVSVGGDGTFLRAAHLASLLAAPVLGVKVGPDGLPHRGRSPRTPDPWCVRSSPVRPASRSASPSRPSTRAVPRSSRSGP